MIERAYTEGETLGLSVWTEDEAGPFQAIPQPGSGWHPGGRPARLPHEYVRGGTCSPRAEPEHFVAKLLTLFHPATGRVRAEGTRSSANAVLHPWLKRELTEILSELPPRPGTPSEAEIRAEWESWYAGLTVRPTLPEALPRLRMLLVLDNLTGHKSRDFVLWCFAQGIALLYTPLGGGWLNMTESIQRILCRRALDGTHPKGADEIIAWLEAGVRGWNAHPTPFVWGGPRAQRRARARAPPPRARRLGCLHPLAIHPPSSAYARPLASIMSADPLEVEVASADQNSEEGRAYPDYCRSRRRRAVRLQPGARTG